MRLKKKLLHKVLRYAESCATGQELSPPEFEEYSERDVNYHIGLCVEAGFLHAFPSKTEAGSGGIPVYSIRNLTWDGHLELEEKQHACKE